MTVLYADVVALLEARNGFGLFGLLGPILVHVLRYHTT